MGLDFGYENWRGWGCERRSRLIYLTYKLVDELVRLRMRDPLEENVLYLVFSELIADT
jgi:hypothetical protein